MRLLRSSVRPRRSHTYDEALKIEPGNSEALNNRSVVLLELARNEELLQSCDRALVVKPHYADALYNRGNALMALGRFEEARASYSAVLGARTRAL